jgi:hypothetical protein
MFKNKNNLITYLFEAYLPNPFPMCIYMDIKDQT